MGIMLTEYFDNDQAIYEKTWRKNRSRRRQFNNGRGTMSTIDRQLEMFENMLNQASGPCTDYDSIMANTSKVGDSLVRRSNLSLAEHNEPLTNATSGHHKLSYLKFIGRSDNSLCANKSKQPKNPQVQLSDREIDCHLWTPLNDLSSESDYADYDDLLDEHDDHDENGQYFGNDCDLIHSIVDIDVEDFGPTKSGPTRLTQDRHVPLFSSSTQQLPSGPCFTLSNQLRTLLHNSNRLKSQNYFFY